MAVEQPTDRNGASCTSKALTAHRRCVAASMAHMSGEIFFCGNEKKHLDIYAIVCYYTFAHGGIAQLGERLNGIQEVSGSIPLISTRGTPQRKLWCSFSFCIRKRHRRNRSSRFLLWLCYLYLLISLRGAFFSQGEVCRETRRRGQARGRTWQAECQRPCRYRPCAGRWARRI